ncbi:MAG TPA: flagellar assembly protein FliX [Caulobacteraceae bacterium]|nr:flagellar assembly protein FliX [Caulobacteraceae bacterium]
MKVGAAGGLGSAQPTALRGAGAPASGFSVGGADAAGDVAAARVGATLGVSSIDALLTLQEVGGPIERRKKAVRRATVILDVLDDLKIGVLEGAIQPHTLGRLIEAVRQERMRTGDPQLEDVLDEIETRAAVELAKLEQHAA